jgi:hypothetical protein
LKEGVLASPKIRTGDIAYSIKLERKPCFQVRAWKGKEFIQKIRIVDIELFVSLELRKRKE